MKIGAKVSLWEHHLVQELPSEHSLQNYLNAKKFLIEKGFYKDARYIGTAGLNPKDLRAEQRP